MNQRSANAWLSLVLAGATALVASPCSAQAPSWGGGAGAGYEMYRFTEPDAAGIRSLSLLTLPFAVQSTLPAGIAVEVSGAYARGTMERANGSEATVTGLTDTELRAGIPIRGDLLVLSGIIVLPTGSSTLSLDEAELAGAIAADLLPFRISHWGNGGGVGAGATLRQPWDAGSVSAGAAYIVAREYEPVETGQSATSFAYRPGNQLRVAVALDRPVGNSGKASLQLGLQRYGDDALAGVNLYRAGNRYEAMGSYAFAAGANSAAVIYAGGLHREQGTALLQLTQNSPSQNLILAGGGVRIPRGWATLVPSLDVRVFRSDDGVGQGFVTSAGASAELPLGGATLVPTLRARFGNVLVREGEESGLTGADIGLAIRFGEPLRRR